MRINKTYDKQIDDLEATLDSLSLSASTPNVFANGKDLVKIHNPALVFQGFAGTTTTPGIHAANRAWIAIQTGDYSLNFTGLTNVTQGQVIVDDGTNYAVEDIDFNYHTPNKKLKGLSLLANQVIDGTVPDLFLNANEDLGQIPIVNYTRASTKWRFNDAGIVEEMPNGVLLPDFDPATRKRIGWKLESDSINKVTHSWDLTNAAWDDNAATALDATGLEGEANGATTVTDNSTASAPEKRFSITVPDDSATHSAFFIIDKTGTPTNFPIFSSSLTGGTNIVVEQIVLNTETGSFVERIGDGTVRVIDAGKWWEIEFTVTNNTTGNTNLTLQIFPAWNSDGTVDINPTATGSVVVAHSQIELNKSFSSSVIRTNGAEGVRATDVADITDLSWLNPLQGTFIMKVILKQTGVDANYLNLISSSIFGEQFELFKNLNEQIFLRVRNNGSLDNVNSGVSVTSPEEEMNIGFSFSPGKQSISVNGNLKTGTFTNPTDFDVLQLFAGEQKMRELTYFPRQLPDAELQQATTL